jgi:hypothetical protein
MATTRSARRTAARMLIVGRLCEAAIDWRLTQTPYNLFFKMEVLAADLKLSEPKTDKKNQDKRGYD